MPLTMVSTRKLSLGGFKDLRNPDDLFAIFDSSPPSPTTCIDMANEVKKGHSNKKTSSLVGFDPLLDAHHEAANKTTNQANGAVVGMISQNVHLNVDTSTANGASSKHPLLSSSVPGSVARSHAGKPPVSASRRLQHRVSKSVCASDLREIASILAQDNPTKEQESRITLGESLKDSIGKTNGKLLRRKHRKAQSLVEFSSERLFGEAYSPIIVRRSSTKHTSSPTTPEGLKKNIAMMNSLTPPRTPPHTPTRRNFFSPNMPIPSSSSSPAMTTMHHTIISIPTLAKQSPTSFLKNAATMAPRSSEQEPSAHQIDISSSQDFYKQAQLCALLDSYQSLGDANFDFNSLKGLSTSDLRTFLDDDDTHCIHGIHMLAPKHKPVVNKLLEFSDSVQVEGFVTHGQDKDLTQVGIFSTQAKRSVIVVFRGTTEQQLRPVAKYKGQRATLVETLDDENPVSVYAPFRTAYFEVESQLYEKLDPIMDENPFCEVVFTGSAFAAALATIGAVRFAIARPMLRFSCHVFGSPKVGLHDFSQFVNTLPNLKVFRVEYGADPTTNLPTDAGSSLKWEHVGHTIAIQASNNNKPQHVMGVTAYRFDHRKPAPTKSLHIRKPENDIQAYVRALEIVVTNKVSWVDMYHGENVGQGVHGKNNEKRLMV